MEKAEIALQLTLKILEQETFDCTAFDNPENPKERNKEYAEYIALIFNTFVENLKIS